MYNPKSFSKFIQLCSRHLNSIWNISITPRLFAVASHSHSQLQTTAKLLSVSIDIPFINISNKWNYIRYYVLHLPFFT